MNNLNKNKVKLLKEKNKDIILIPPIKDDNISLLMLIFRLSNIDTKKSNIKSKKKLINIIKSI